MKSKDFSLKLIQHNIGASATACIQSLDNIKNDKKIPQEIKQKLAQTICDALVLNAKCMQDISCVRMQLIKPALNHKFADQLIMLRHHDSKQLFGNDLAKDIKEIDEATKATRDLGRMNTTYSNSRSPTNANRGRGYNPRFQGRGGFYGRTKYRGRGYRGNQNPYYGSYNSQNVPQSKDRNA